MAKNYRLPHRAGTYPGKPALAEVVNDDITALHRVRLMLAQYPMYKYTVILRSSSLQSLET
ncbi:hypothetical protein EK904_011389, partial [Melospiza melodia maxima]